jgi:hypothetical protein
MKAGRAQVMREADLSRRFIVFPAPDTGRTAISFPTCRARITQVVPAVHMPGYRPWVYVWIIFLLFSLRSLRLGGETQTSQKAQAFEEGRFLGGLWSAITE